MTGALIGTLEEHPHGPVGAGEALPLPFNVRKGWNADVSLLHAAILSPADHDPNGFAEVVPLSNV